MQTSYNYGHPTPQVFVYQVEFNAIATGKIIAMSKRRIRWRYGFPNQEAISAGQSGSHCRGEEHDVSLVWSVSSGKRMIMSNGKQLYVGVNKASIFEQQWIDTRGNTIKLTAHTAPPMSNASSSRQYDLIINGKSFFDLPKSYEIGLKGPADVRTPGIITATNQMMVQAPQRVAPVYSESGRNMVPQSQEEEMDDLQRAIRESLTESRNHLARKGLLEEESARSTTLSSVKTPPEAQPPTSEGSLIDFLSDASPSVTSNPMIENNNALITINAPPQQYQIDPFGQNSGPAYSTTIVDEFAPKGPSYNDISDQILLNYSSPQKGAVNAPDIQQQQQQIPPQNQTNTATARNPFDDTPPQNHAATPYGHPDRKSVV